MADVSFEVKGAYFEVKYHSVDLQTVLGPVSSEK